MKVWKRRGHPYHASVSQTSLTQRRSYNTMIERQSSMPLDGMDTTMFVNLIETMHIEYGLSLPQSLIALQLFIRLGQVPLQSYIFEKRFASKVGQETQLFKSLIETDLKRDLKKLQKEDPSVTLSSLKREHYSIGKIMNWGLTAYTQLHVYKALCLMANHTGYYTDFVQDVAFWSSHDPTMLTLPLLVMALNFSLLERSRHPFLVNVRQRWSPMTKALLVLYGSGVAMVLP